MDNTIQGKTVVFPVLISYEPEEDPEFTYIKDSSGRYLSLEEVVILLNTFSPH